MATICTSYNPSETETERFWASEYSRPTPRIDVPVGFPKELVSPLAWKGSQIQDKVSEWKLDLTEEEVSWINTALADFEG